MNLQQLKAFMAWVNAKFEDAKFGDFQSRFQVRKAEERLLSLFEKKEGGAK